MKAEFWHDRWENNLTGFHLDEVNPYLKQFWHQLNLKPGARIFVPLCGKSIDLLWLAEQGHTVIGVELSPLAVEAFFAENSLEAEHRQQGDFEVWQSGSITIYCGDFFSLTQDNLGDIDAVYDRASLVALPAGMRQDYAQKLAALCPAAPRLLVALEYEQSKMDGPPFSVPEAEITALYGNDFEINPLLRQDMLGANEKFRTRGLDYLEETIYLLTKK